MATQAQRAVPTDVSKEPDVLASFASIGAGLGRLDLVFNNAEGVLAEHLAGRCAGRRVAPRCRGHQPRRRRFRFCRRHSS